MKTLNLWIDNFWPEFNIKDNLFCWALSHNYQLIITSENPDVIITTNEDYIPTSNNSKIIFCQTEPWFLTRSGNLDKNKFSSAISTFKFTDPFFKRLPLVLLYNYEYYKMGIIDDYEYLIKHTPKIKHIPEKFCSFICRNPAYGGYRSKFFNMLSEYKFVNSHGTLNNNSFLAEGSPGTMEGSIKKMDLLSQYKFNICFDNAFGCIKSFNETNVFISDSGIFTEKLYESLISDTLPIYWGNKDVGDDINSNCIINVHKYESFEKVVEKIIEIDNDDDLYLDYINQKYILETKNNIFSKEYIVNLMQELIEK